jgi:hypothetical protein
MNRPAAALILSLALAGPALAAPGDPRLIEGTLEWPPTLAGGELFVVLHGDDGRVYSADVMAAQRELPGVLNAGSRLTLLGLEGVKSHEIVAVALGSGNATALSLTLAQGTRTTPPMTPPATPPTPPETSPPPTAIAAAVSAVGGAEGRPAPGDDGRRLAVHGSVLEVVGPTLFIRKGDGHVVGVDLSRLDPGSRPRLTPGSPVAVVAVTVGTRLEATGFIATETPPVGSRPATPTPGAAPPAAPAAASSPALHPQRPVRRQVVYPHGKYVLYGDGVNQAYRWVWIPANPPVGSPAPPR